MLGAENAGLEPYKWYGDKNAEALQQRRWSFFSGFLNPKKQSGQTRREKQHHAEDDEDGHDHPYIIEDFFCAFVEKK